MLDEKIWIKVIRAILKTGGYPFPINDNLMELTQILLTEEEAQFLLIFRIKNSLNINQIKAKTDLDEDLLEKMLNQLMDKGIIVGVLSRSRELMVYHLNNYLPGIFEYTFMKGGTGERDKKIAHIFERLDKDLTELFQKNYDRNVEQLRKIPPGDRIVPIEETIDVQPEVVLQFEEISKLINKFDNISVAICYCRHHKDLLDDHCKIDAPKLTCMQLGKSAVFSTAHGFAKPISKDEAITILRKAEDVGLVHRVVHSGINLENEEVTICNCCKCCCDQFQKFYRGTIPLMSRTSYVAKVESDLCSGCGTCVEKCPVESPKLVNDISVVDENRCIGCGVCAYHCPEEAINLNRTGPRVAFIPPPRIEQS